MTDGAKKRALITGMTSHFGSRKDLPVADLVASHG